MGTHPIFESDFDCLTDVESKCTGEKKEPREAAKRASAISASRLSQRERATGRGYHARLVLQAAHAVPIGNFIGRSTLCGVYTIKYGCRDERVLWRGRHYFDFDRAPLFDTLSQLHLHATAPGTMAHGLWCLVVLLFRACLYAFSKYGTGPRYHDIHLTTARAC